MFLLLFGPFQSLWLDLEPVFVVIVLATGRMHSPTELIALSGVMDANQLWNNTAGPLIPQAAVATDDCSANRPHLSVSADRSKMGDALEIHHAAAVLFPCPHSPAILTRLPPSRRWPLAIIPSRKRAEMFGRKI